MRLCLWEDGIEQLEPLSLTRPVFDLRCGFTTLGEKQRRAVGVEEWGALVRPPLEELFNLQHPNVPVNDSAWLHTDSLVLVNGRWLPPDDGFTLPASSCVGMVGDTVAYVVLHHTAMAISLDGLSELLEEWQQTLAVQPAGGEDYYLSVGPCRPKRE